MMTQEQRLDEQMECMVRWNDPFAGQVLWHVSRAGERMINQNHIWQTGHKGGYTIENLATFRAEVDAVIAAIDSSDTL